MRQECQAPRIFVISSFTHTNLGSLVFAAANTIALLCHHFNYLCCTRFPEERQELATTTPQALYPHLYAEETLEIRQNVCLITGTVEVTNTDVLSQAYPQGRPQEDPRVPLPRGRTRGQEGLQSR